jgi:predicted permease
LSVVLLVGAGLFVRSLLNVRGLHLGYDVRPVLVVTDNPRGVKLTNTERISLESRLVDAARAMPGVVAATPVSSVPFWGYEEPYLFVSGDTVSRLGDFVLQAGTPDYFRTMGTRIVRGRSFDDHDRAEAARVVVVSQGMAKLLWPASDPIGKCIRIEADTAPCTTVVGVAEDLHMRSLRGQREYTYYIPIAQYRQAPGMLLVRVAGDATDYVEPVRRQLQRIMPGAAYVTAQPFQNMVDPTMQSWRFGATMFAAFGALALALAGIGLYSMIAYGVAQRRREIGVRIALGASRANVVRLVVRGGLRLVVLGVVLGGAISLWAGKWVATLLFDEAPTDPVIYATVATVLIAVSLAATALPALAASRVDPNVALRAD